METVRRRFSSVFSGSRRPSDEYRRERGDPGPSSSFNRGVPPSAEDGPFRSRLNSGASSMERPRMSGQVGRLPEGVEFIRYGKAFRYSHDTSSWLPPQKGYVRILASPTTGLRRLQVRTDSTYGTSTLVINCFITPTMTLFPRGARAYTFSTAADWSFGEPTWETFAIRFSEKTGGALFADEFAQEFEKARGINTALMEGGAQEEEHDRLGLRAHGSKTSLGSFGASTGKYDGGKLLKKLSRSRSPDERGSRR